MICLFTGANSFFTLANIVLDVGICVFVTYYAARCDHAFASLRRLVKVLHCATAWTVISTVYNLVTMTLRSTGYPSYGNVLAIIG